jgi:hypothetical protein
MAEWTNQLQQDRLKQTDAFVRSMYRKLQPEDYLKRVIDASLQVPDDIAVVLIYNMIAVKDFCGRLCQDSSTGALCLPASNSRRCRPVEIEAG